MTFLFADRTLLTPGEVLARWGGLVTPRTLERWRMNGVGSGPPFLRLGGKVFYPLDKLEAWERVSTVTRTQDYRRAAV